MVNRIGYKRYKQGPEGEANANDKRANTEANKEKDKGKKERIVFHTGSHCNGAPDVACT